MDFMIKGLSPHSFQHLYGLSDSKLKSLNAYRYRADASPGFPDRIEMRDAEIGESLILVNHRTIEGATPYAASHAIFVLEGATQAYEAINTIPDVMHRRLLSLRAIDENQMIIDAELAEGDAIAPTIQRLCALSGTKKIHAHYALRGCFAAEITALSH